MTRNTYMTSLIHARAAFRYVGASYLLLACAILWIALMPGAVRASGGVAAAPAPGCPGTTSGSVPLEQLTPESVTNVDPIAGLGHAVRYRGKALTIGVQLSGPNGGSASATYVLGGHYRRYTHLIGTAYEDDANTAIAPSLEVFSPTNIQYHHDFTGTHDKVSFDINIQGAQSITLRLRNPGSSLSTLDVVARLTP